MIIKIKLNSFIGISLSTFTFSTTETWCKPCSELTIETPEWR